MIKKRLTKKEKKIEKFKRLQESRKEKRKRSHTLKRVKRQEKLHEMTEEERREFINNEREQEEFLKKECERVSLEGIPLVFDLSYCDLMTSVELGSLQSQISDSVGYLRKQFPQYFKLVCANVPGEIREKLQKRGAKKWGLHLRSEEIDKDPEFVHKNIVYLSPDAEECLENIEENCVYVIGGLVDRTIVSKQSLERAVGLGIKAKRLPVKEFLGKIAKPERRVFNINTVVQILHLIASGKDWKNALAQSIPKRHLKSSENPKNIEDVEPYAQIINENIEIT